MNNHKSINELVESLSPQEIKRLLVEKLTSQRLGLVWESDSDLPPPSRTS